MTIVETDPAASTPEETDAAASASSTPRRRRVGAGVIVLVVAGLALAVWLAWWAVSASAVAGVRVVSDLQPVSCDGAEVGARAHDAAAGDAVYVRPVVVLTEGMRCSVSIHVVNDGWSDVEVRAIGLPGMAEGMGTGLEPALVSPNGQLRLPDGDGTGAARFAIDGISLPAGQATTFTAMVDYSGGAFMSECSGSGLPAPDVTVSSLGAERLVAPAPEDLIFWQQGGLEECAEELQ